MQEKPSTTPVTTRKGKRELESHDDDDDEQGASKRIATAGRLLKLTSEPAVPCVKPTLEQNDLGDGSVDTSLLRHGCIGLNASTHDCDEHKCDEHKCDCKKNDADDVTDEVDQEEEEEGEDDVDDDDEEKGGSDDEGEGEGDVDDEEDNDDEEDEEIEPSTICPLDIYIHRTFVSDLDALEIKTNCPSALQASSSIWLRAIQARVDPSVWASTQALFTNISKERETMAAMMRADAHVWDAIDDNLCHKSESESSNTTECCRDHRCVNEHFASIDDDLCALERRISDVRQVMQLSVVLRASDAASVLRNDEWKIVIGYSEFPNCLPLAFQGELTRRMGDFAIGLHLTSEIAHTRGPCRNDCGLLAQPVSTLVVSHYPECRCPYWTAAYRPLRFATQYDGVRRFTLTLDR